MNSTLRRFLKNVVKNSPFIRQIASNKRLYLCGILSTAIASGFLIRRHQISNFFQPISIAHAKEIASNDTEKNVRSSDDQDFLNLNPRRRLFEHFTSVEYNGTYYMTPNDFIESVTGQNRLANTKKRVLTHNEYEKIMKETPSKKRASKNLFRNLENNGLITYSEYIFLLCVITKPKSSFEIAFNMFDIDGSKTVDKLEFLVMTKIFERDSEAKVEKVSSKKSTKKSIVNVHVDTNPLIESLKVIEAPSHMNTTLVVHLFGKNGDETLTYDDFKNFMINLQTEILEVEFNQYAKGLTKLTEFEFAEILLKYTTFDEETKALKINKLESQMDSYKRGIKFDSFVQFSTLMNNLDDFALAVKYHTLANKSINKKEFQRAVKISTGFELDNQLVDVIYKVFDENDDEQLSYREFIAVMKDRLRRNPKSYFKNYSQFLNEKVTFSKKFKSCLKTKLREDDYYSS